MSYRWVADAGTFDAEAAQAAGLDQRFASHTDAESWLTSFYDDLAEQGITSVSLYEEDRLVYGPMSLLDG